MRVAILAHGKFPDGAKTAVGVIRYGDQDVVAVLDRDAAGTTVDDHLPDVDCVAPVVETAAEAPPFDALIVGIAPIGGGFDESWRPDVRTAIESGADVIAGLHYFLETDSEFRNLAEEYGVELRDVRKPPDDLTVSEGIARDLNCEIVLTVGTDCSTGKMTTTLELLEAARDAGLDAGFVPTGQTGIMIADRGIPIDRTISDFTAGAVERMLVEQADDHDYLFVEGQGSILHPAYSAVTCGIVHGAMPDAMILCHEAGREEIRGYESYRIPDVRGVADRYEAFAEPVAPTEVVAGSLNTYGMDGDAADEAIAEYEDRLGVPASDPIRYDAGTLLEEL